MDQRVLNFIFKIPFLLKRCIDSRFLKSYLLSKICKNMQRLLSIKICSLECAGFLRFHKTYCSEIFLLRVDKPVD